MKMESYGLEAKAVEGGESWEQKFRERVDKRWYIEIEYSAGADKYRWTLRSQEDGEMMGYEATFDQALDMALQIRAERKGGDDA